MRIVTLEAALALGVAACAEPPRPYGPKAVPYGYGSAPWIYTGPQLLDLGEIAVGDTAAGWFELRNQLEPNVARAEAAFSDTSTQTDSDFCSSPVVAFSYTAHLCVAVTPHAPGHHFVDVTVSDTAYPPSCPTYQNVLVRLYAREPAARLVETRVDFGVVDQGDVAIRYVTAINDGLPLGVTVAVEGAGLDQAEPDPLELEAGAESAIRLTYSPAGPVAPFEGRLTLSYLGEVLDEAALVANLPDDGPGAADEDGDGVTVDGGDCDDTDALRFPGADEVEDRVDQDCDGLVDEGFVDLDGDGSLGRDCDDADPWVGRGFLEHADDADNDCDGSIDEDLAEEYVVCTKTRDGGRGCSSVAAPLGQWHAMLVACVVAFRRRLSARAREDLDEPLVFDRARGSLADFPWPARVPRIDPADLASALREEREEREDLR